MWSKVFWDDFYTTLPAHSIILQRSANDHVEVGAPPIRIQDGWLLIYCYIYNYFIQHATFAIEAVILKDSDPKQVVARTRQPIVVPKKHYELYGLVPNVIFPSGALIENNDILIYYGAADTTVCLVNIKLNELLGDMLPQSQGATVFKTRDLIPVVRNPGNPIISPRRENKWESQFTFNPGAIYEGNRVHLLYRAMGSDNTSVLGYAVSPDGYKIGERESFPVYFPREAFEMKQQGSGNSGCEDPRVVKIDGRIYMCYTAFNSKDNPRVALTSISTDDFYAKKWNWEKPILISPPKIDDKDATLFPTKINGKYVFLHRFSPNVWIDYVDDLSFHEGKYLNGEILMTPRVYSWDSEKIGIGPPPILCESGWLLIYHGLSRYSKKYRLGAVLLARDNPSLVLSQLDYPILEPESFHESKGARPGTVFCNGAVVLGEMLYLYYGAGDEVIDVARLPLEKLLGELKKYRI